MSSGIGYPRAKKTRDPAPLWTIPLFKSKDTLNRYNWIIHHCPNVSEGTYDVMVSVWNPLDGFRHSAPTVIKVMERIGPIWIDDFQMVTDHVRKWQNRTLNSKAM